MIGDKLWELFHEKRKEKHAWYYTSISHAVDESKDEFAYLEYKRLVKDVFGQYLLNWIWFQTSVMGQMIV